MNRLLFLVLVLVAVISVECNDRKRKKLRLPWWRKKSDIEIMKKCNEQNLGGNEIYNATVRQRECSLACMLNEHKYIKDNEINVKQMIEDLKQRYEKKKKELEKKHKENNNMTDEEKERQLTRLKHKYEKIKETKIECAETTSKDNDDCNLAGKFINCTMKTYLMFSQEKMQIYAKCGKKLSVNSKNYWHLEDDIKNEFNLCTFKEQNYIIHKIDTNLIIKDLKNVFGNSSTDDENNNNFEKMYERVKICAKGKNSNELELIKKYFDCMSEAY